MRLVTPAGASREGWIPEGLGAAAGKLERPWHAARTLRTYRRGLAPLRAGREEPRRVLRGSSYRVPWVMAGSSGVCRR